MNKIKFSHCSKPQVNYLYLLYIIFIALPILLIGTNSSAVTADTVYTDNPDSINLRNVANINFGEIKPLGWALEYLQRDLEGITGNLYKVKTKGSMDPYTLNNACCEIAGNWIDSYLKTAYLSSNKEHIDNAIKYLAEILQIAKSRDNYIGVYNSNKRLGIDSNNCELWSQSRIHLALFSLYDITKNESVLSAIVNSVEYTMKTYVSKSGYFSKSEGTAGGMLCHGLMFIDVLFKLYSITLDEKYINYSEFLYKDYMLADVQENDIQHFQVEDTNRPLMGHAAHIAEQLRIPIIMYEMTKNVKYLSIFNSFYNSILRYLTPSGALIGGERVNNLVPSQYSHYEYCTLTELLISFQQAYHSTQNYDIPDLIDNLVFNAAQGARLPNGKAITYLTSDTRLSAENSLKRGRLAFSPAHVIGGSCCQANSGRIMPYYIANIWKKFQSNNGQTGLALNHFIPSVLTTEVNNQKICITQSTTYPFGDKIKLTISTDKPIKFQIFVRKPRWANSMTISVNNAYIKSTPRGYIISKFWDDKDSILLNIKPDIVITKTAMNTFSIKRGTLLFVKPLKYRMNIAKTYNVDNLYDYNIVPVKPEIIDDFSYLLLHEKKSQQAYISHTIRPIVNYPLDNSPITLRLEMVDSLNRPRYVELVPIGSTILRIAEFNGYP